MRTTIAAKLYFGFGSMAAVIVASAAFIVQSTNQAQGDYEKLSDASRGDDLITSAHTIYLQQRLGHAEFAAADPMARGEILAAEHERERDISKSLDAYSELPLAQQDRERLAELRNAYQKYADASTRWFSLYGGGQLQEAATWAASALTPSGAAAAQAFDHLIELQDGEISDDLLASHMGAMRKAMSVFIGVALLMAAGIAFFITRSIVKPLAALVAMTKDISNGDFSQRLTLDRSDEFGVLYGGFNKMVEDLTSLVGEMKRSGIQVDTSVNEIAATAKQQQATASEVAATTMEIGATSKEISATSKELVKTMNEVSSVAEQSATLAGSGQAGLSRMEETMRHVMEAGSSINARLAVLNEKAGTINQVVTTITKVADQTNLLSLNAAIEAEKAGEYGRGFSVVASEIRRLADQTAVATYDIEQMVKEIQSAVSAGVMGMDKFTEEVRRGMNEVQQVGTHLSQIIQHVQALAPQVESVNEGMQAQATGAEQISEALMLLSEGTQQTVESLGQSGLALQELNLAAAGMRSSGERFRLRA